MQTYRCSVLCVRVYACVRVRLPVCLCSCRCFRVTRAQATADSYGVTFHMFDKVRVTHVMLCLPAL